MSLTVVKRRRKPETFVACSNGCKDNRFNGFKMGVKVASYNAVILGHDVPLCARCAKAWPGIWDSAHSTPQTAVNLDSQALTVCPATATIRGTHKAARAALERSRARPSKGAPMTTEYYGLVR